MVVFKHFLLIQTQGLFSSEDGPFYRAKCFLHTDNCVFLPKCMLFWEKS